MPRRTTNETDGQRSVARPREVPLLTSCRDGPIVKLDLVIDHILARECRGTAGSLENMEMVAETPAPGAKLTTRRSQVQVLAPLLRLPLCMKDPCLIEDIGLRQSRLARDDARQIDHELRRYLCDRLLRTDLVYLRSAEARSH